jgi:hypothetical protein
LSFYIKLNLFLIFLIFFYLKKNDFFFFGIKQVRESNPARIEASAEPLQSCVRAGLTNQSTEELWASPAILSEGIPLVKASRGRFYAANSRKIAEKLRKSSKKVQNKTENPNGGPYPRALY